MTHPFSRVLPWRVGEAPEALSEEELAFCEEESRRECQRMATVEGISVGTALLMAGLFEYFVVEDAPYHDHLFMTLPVQMLSAYALSVALYFSELARRHTIRVTMAMVILVGVQGGVVLGGMGGFDGPFFYSIYMLPTFIMLVPCGLVVRILATLTIEVGFAAAFLAMQPALALPAAADITVASVFIIASACVLLGHRNWRVSRERALAMFRLDRERSLIRARNEELAEHVRRQARRARSLANELFDARSSERLNIARDLHDDVGQLLVGAKMELELLELRSARDEVLEFEQLDRLYEVLHGLEGGVRDMIRSLRASDAAIDLAPALDELIEPHRGRVSLDVKLSPERLAELSDERGRMIYRVVQEGLTNAAKHSDAEVWRVRLEEPDAGTVRVAIEDEGSRDFAPEDGDGWGLLGLKERARALGAEVRLSRASGRTILEALIPCGG